MASTTTDAQEIITVELNEATIRMASGLGLDLSQLANELLSKEIDKLTQSRCLPPTSAHPSLP